MLQALAEKMRCAILKEYKIDHSAGLPIILMVMSIGVGVIAIFDLMAGMESWLTFANLMSGLLMLVFSVYLLVKLKKPTSIKLFEEHIEMPQLAIKPKPLKIKYADITSYQIVDAGSLKIFRVNFNGSYAQVRTNSLGGEKIANEIIGVLRYKVAS